MSSTKLVGYDAVLEFGGTDLQVKSWECTITAEKLEITYMGSQGWKQTIQGLQDCEGSFDAIFDTAINTASNSLPLPASGTGTLTLALGDSTLTIPVNIYSMGIKADVEGLIEYSGDFSLGIGTPSFA